MGVKWVVLKYSSRTGTVLRRYSETKAKTKSSIIGSTLIKSGKNSWLGVAVSVHATLCLCVQSRVLKKKGRRTELTSRELGTQGGRSKRVLG